MFSLEIELSPALRVRPGERVVAAQYIPLHTLLATISPTALLSLKTTSFPAQLVAPLLQHSSQLTLALVLLHESILPTSPWSAYIRSLPPRTVPVATLWSPTALELIQGTSLAAFLHRMPNLQDTLSAFYHVHVVPLIASLHPNDLPPTLDAFRHAYSLVSSRAFTVNAYHGLSLVPFADMLDHANPISEDHAGPYNNIDFRSDYWVCSTCGMVDSCAHDGDDETRIQHRDSEKISSACEIVSILPILQGEEIFNNYGRLDNSALLAHYGFALEDNEFDRINWSLEEILEEFKIEEEVEERLDDLVVMWRSTTNEREENQLVLDESLAEERKGSRLFVNSDAKLSRPLWILVALIVMSPLRTEAVATAFDSLFQLDAFQSNAFSGLEAELTTPTMTQESNQRLVEAVGRLCRRRIEAGHRPELTVDEILALANESSIEVKLAMECVAAERTRLQCVESLFGSLIIA